MEVTQAKGEVAEDERGAAEVEIGDEEGNLGGRGHGWDYRVRGNK